MDVCSYTQAPSQNPSLMSTHTNTVTALRALENIIGILLVMFLSLIEVPNVHWQDCNKLLFSIINQSADYSQNK